MLSKIMSKMFPKLNKLLTIMDAIEHIEVTENNSLYLKLKNHVAIEADGSILTYTKNGNIITKSNMLYIQPTIDTKYFNIKNDGSFIELNKTCYVSYKNKVIKQMLSKMKFKEITNDNTTDKK